MTQAAMTISNGAGAVVRTALNATLGALNSTQRGAARPSGAVAGTLWLQSVSAIEEALFLYDGAQDVQLGWINPTTHQWNLSASGGTVSNLTSLSVVAATANLAFFRSTGANWAAIFVDAAQTGQQSQVILQSAGVSKWSLMRTASDAFALYDHAASKNFLAATSGGALALGAAQNFSLDQSGNVTASQVYANTTASAANMFITSGGLMQRSTSSLRYKNSVTDYTRGLAEVMALRPVFYKGNSNGDEIFAGLIAEEVNDAGLNEFVQYDDEGRPDALAYGNMAALLIAAIKDLKNENDALKARVAALEAG